MSLDPTPASPYGIRPWEGSSEGFPLVIQARDDRDPARLCRFLAEHHEWALQSLAAHGALLFRGFDVEDAPVFERVARAVDPELKNE